MLNILWIIIFTFLALIIGLFIIRRKLLFDKYIQESRIVFLPNRSFLKGSYDLVNNSACPLISKVDEYFKSIDEDTFGSFFGPYPMIFTKDLDLLKKIMITDSHKHINRTDMFGIVRALSKSIPFAHDDRWRRVRRSIGSTLTPAKLRSSNLEQDIEDCMNLMMRKLDDRILTENVEKNERSTIIDGHKFFRHFTMDIALRSSLKQSNMINYDSNDSEIVVIGENLLAQATSSAVLWSVFIPSIVPLLGYIVNKLSLLKFVDYIERFVLKILSDNVKSRRGLDADKTKVKVIDSLVELFNQNKINKDELIGNNIFMLMASWDTTGDTLIAIMWHLAKNSQVQEKLRNDLLKNGTESQYLDWTIKEALRLSPPASGMRTIGEDFAWKGYKIMKGMNFVLTNRLVHCDERFWGNDASDFKPERFEKSDQFHSAQYFPFGLGPRNCVGYYQAMAIIKIFTTSMILNYQVQPCNGTPKELDIKFSNQTLIFIFAIKHPVPLKLVKLTTVEV